MNDNPGGASRPFDICHDGIVLSEGSCLVMLESENSAAQRGAHLYAEILGIGSSCDAKGIYGTDSVGSVGARTIHQLLRTFDITPSDIDYVCAHANGSPTFDKKETRVIRSAFGEYAAQIPVSSIKGILGHPFGAAGAFQTAASALAIESQLIPPTYNLESPDPDCGLSHVAGLPRQAIVATALITSYGYGGVNACALLRRPT